MNSRMIPVDWLPQYTYADYKSWEGDWELIHGIPYAMSPSAKRTHQSIARRLLRLLEDAVMQKADDCNCELFYELDWIVNDTTVVRPDIMIVCGEFTDDFLRFPPSLIIEVTSKRTQMADRNVKYKVYEANGVSCYIIADPERQTIDTYILQDGRYTVSQQTSFVMEKNCEIEVDLQKVFLQI